MMTVLRHILCLLTALCVGVLGVSTASAKPLAALAPMVICGESGPETLYLSAQDQNGQPIEKCCNCADCTAAQSADLPQRHALYHSGAWQALPLLVLLQDPAAQRHFQRPMPRAPPLEPRSQTAQTLGGDFFTTLELSQIDQKAQHADFGPNFEGTQ